jgi:hypothetical protein
MSVKGVDHNAVGCSKSEGSILDKCISCVWEADCLFSNAEECNGAVTKEDIGCLDTSIDITKSSERVDIQILHNCMNCKTYGDCIKDKEKKYDPFRENDCAKWISYQLNLKNDADKSLDVKGFFNLKDVVILQKENRHYLDIIGFFESLEAMKNYLIGNGKFFRGLTFISQGLKWEDGKFVIDKDSKTKWKVVAKDRYSVVKEL